eukprot:5223410-Pyramimonas_sp.AAC.1
MIPPEGRQELSIWIIVLLGLVRTQELNNSRGSYAASLGGCCSMPFSFTSSLCAIPARGLIVLQELLRALAPSLGVLVILPGTALAPLDVSPHLRYVLLQLLLADLRAAFLF